jgi:hypothetical protein
MTMAWSWGSTPHRLLTDKRLLNLDHTHRLVAMLLYVACDQHGRVDAYEASLRIALGIIDGTEILPIVERLAAARVIWLYTVNDGLFGQLDHYDDDIGASVKRRSRSVRPSPPANIWKAAGCTGINRGDSVEEPSTEAIAHPIHSPVFTPCAHGEHAVNTPCAPCDPKVGLLVGLKVIPGAPETPEPPKHPEPPIPKQDALHPPIRPTTAHLDNFGTRFGLPKPPPPPFDHNSIAGRAAAAVIAMRPPGTPTEYYPDDGRPKLTKFETNVLFGQEVMRIEAEESAAKAAAAGSAA